jgi:uncharacterized phage-like protein YoqJ
VELIDMTVIAFTGHRPQKIGGFKLPNPTYIHICQQIDKVLRELKPNKVISGGALGIDQWSAVIAHKLGIPYLLAIPFEGQECKWPETSQKTYRLIRKLASEEVIVSPGGYSVQKMMTRNEWMVDHCDKLIAVYDGDTTGGTFNCVQYAKSIGKEIILIDPNKVEAGKYWQCKECDAENCIDDTLCQNCEAQ